MIDDTQLLTTLDAVNYILIAGGQNGVQTLTGGNNVIQSALNHLSYADLELQNVGWSWNTIYARDFVPDVNSEVELPDNTLVLGPSRSLKAKYLPYCKLTKRFDEGTPKLFNAEEGTFTIDRTVTLQISQRLPFEELPPAARTVTAARAAQRFNSAFVNDPMVHRELDKRIRDNLVTLEQTEDEFNRNHNHFENNLHAAQQFNHRGRWG